MTTGKPKLIQNKILQLAVCLLLCGICSGSMVAQTPDPAPADSTQQLRKHYSGKDTWEHIVSFPGTVVSLPFLLVSKTSEAAAGYIYEHKLIPRTIAFFQSETHRRGLSPKFSNRTGIGVKVYQEGMLSADDQLSFTVSGNFGKRQRYRLQWQDIQPALLPVLLTLRGQYFNLPGESFFGLGSHSRESAKTVFDHEYTEVSVTLDFLLTSHLRLGAIARFDHNNVYASDEDDLPSITTAYDRASLPGLQTRVRVFQYGAMLNWDAKNRPGNPTAGQEALLSAALFRDVDGGVFNFRKYAADVSQYLHLGANRVLKLRLAGEISEPQKTGDAVPFYYLSELGEQESIRGFSRGRFRGADLFIGSVEYRIPIWRKFDIFGFVDAGQVAGDILEELSARDLQFGYGGGLRLFTEKELVAMGQIAISREMFRVYLNLY